MAKQAVKKAATKKVEIKKVSTGGEPIPKKEKAPAKENIFKGMKPEDKKQVLSDMLMDAFKYSNEVLKQTKEQLRLFDLNHPILDAMSKNEIVLQYMNEIEA